MKRIEFLKKLGLGIGVIAIAPKVLAEMPDKDTKRPIQYTSNLNDVINVSGVGGCLVTAKYKFAWEEYYTVELTPMKPTHGIIIMRETNHYGTYKALTLDY